MPNGQKRKHLSDATLSQLLRLMYDVVSPCPDVIISDCLDDSRIVRQRLTPPSKEISACHFVTGPFVSCEFLRGFRNGIEQGQCYPFPASPWKVLRNLREFFGFLYNHAVDWEDIVSSEHESSSRYRQIEIAQLHASGYKLNHSSSTSQTVTMASKIQLYSMATPNGQKIGVALEEMGLEYEPHTINIGKNETFTPEFIKINPNSKIPAIIDPEGPDGKPITIFESGAILLYLAEKSGKFLSTNPRHRWETIQWLMFQMAGVGPMFGQFGHFYRFAKDKCLDPYPTERYGNESMRLLGVIEKRLEGRDFIIDDGYSIADMAMFPWIRAAKSFYGEKLEFHKFPLVNAWVERCFARPASAKGTTVCSL